MSSQVIDPRPTGIRICGYPDERDNRLMRENIPLACDSGRSVGGRNKTDAYWCFVDSAW